MRSEDLEPLRRSYEPGQVGQDATYIILHRLGWPLDALWQLERQMLDDLDPERFGIGWWIGHIPDARTRILISDHLVDGVVDVAINLLEAHVHLSNWRELRASGLQQRQWRRRPDGNWMLRPAEAPVEMIPGVERDMHLVGFFRAVGSTLDCLSALIVGVGALQTSLRSAGWAGVKKQLAKPQHREAADALKVGDALTAGPTGWDQWGIDMRNMLVHRPRRMWFNDVGGPFDVRKRDLLYLPAQPAMSHVEGMLQAKRLGSPGSLTEEDADQTLAGIATSTSKVVQVLAERLLDLWERRREAPDLIPQPSKQWDDAPDDPGFRGYGRLSPPKGRPGMEMMLAAKQGRRIQAAALHDHDRRRVWGR